MKQVIPEYKNLVDLFQDAIDKERDAEMFYREAAELAQSTEIRQFLLELSATEHEHFLALSQKLEQVRAEMMAMNGIMASYHEPNQRDGEVNNE
jgi:rubrerythrin